MNSALQSSLKSTQQQAQFEPACQPDWSCRSSLTPLPSSSRHNSCEPILLEKTDANTNVSVSSTDPSYPPGMKRKTQSAIVGSRAVKPEPVDACISSLSCPTNPSSSTTTNPSAKRKRPLAEHEPTRIQPMRAVKRARGTQDFTMKAEVQIVETLDFDDDVAKSPISKPRKPRKVKAEPVEGCLPDSGNRLESKRPPPRSTKRDSPIPSQPSKLVLRIPARPPLADATANGTSVQNAIVIKPDPDVVEVDSISALKQAATKADHPVSPRKKVRRKRRKPQQDSASAVTAPAVKVKTEPMEKLTIRIPASSSRTTQDHSHTPKETNSRRADHQFDSNCADEKHHTSPLQRSDSGFFSEVQGEDRIPPVPTPAPQSRSQSQSHLHSHLDVVDLTVTTPSIDKSLLPPIPSYCEVIRESIWIPIKTEPADAPLEEEVEDPSAPIPVVWHFHSRFEFEMVKKPMLSAVDWGNG